MCGDSVQDDHETTIYDVATHAGVSIATVSRYVNGTAAVSEVTARRIAQAIEHLHFMPNRIARSLKTTRSNVIMMVVPDICNLFYSELYKNVQVLADDKGYAIMLHNSNEAIDYELRALELTREHRCDALIFFSVYYSEEMNRRIQRLNIPVYQNLSADALTDDEPAIYLTTKHLISYGHRDIVYVGGAVKTRINERRRKGFMTAMEEANLPCNTARWFEMDFTIEAGYKAGLFISALPERPTAICAANDQLAIGILLSLTESGIRVPDDISLTGMDDVEYARLTNPPLTTIRNDPKPIAQNIIDRLFKQLEGVEPPPNVKEPPPMQVIVRGSTRRL